jgi:hypothetical protein
MIAKTIYSKFYKNLPNHIYILGDKHIFTEYEKEMLAWGQVKIFMEMIKPKYKQAEFKNNMKFINEIIKGLKS